MWFDGPLILSGAIATGGAILAARAAGADLAYVGSPFIATDEANASDDYKQGWSTAAPPTSSTPTSSPGCTAIICVPPSNAAGPTPTRSPPGNLDTMKFGADGSAKAKAWRDIWGSGQGIGVIDRVRPAAELIDLLANQYRAAQARFSAN